MKKYVKFLSILFAASILFVSCEENLLGDQPTQEDVEIVSKSVAQNGGAQMTAIKVFENVNNYGISEEGVDTKSGTIGEPIKNWNANKDSLELDFGANGKLFAAFNKPNPDYTSGLKVTITFENYDDGNAKVTEGTLSIEITEVVKVDSVVESIKFNIVSEGLTMIEGDKSYVWSVDQIIDWVEGVSTSDSNDDSYTIEGESSLTETNDAGQEVFTKITINEALMFVAGCEYAQSGEMTTVQTIDGDDEITIKCNFGEYEEGTCDSVVTLSAGFITFDLDLAK
jgi:hypothetical protein